MPTPPDVSQSIASSVDLVAAMPTSQVVGAIASEYRPVALTIAVGVLMLAATHVAGKLIARLGQPAVTGEMLAGIALGPSLVGRLAPDAMDSIIGVVFPRLRPIAYVTVVLYMFAIGIELDVRQVQQRARQVFVISASGIVVPTFLGAIVAQLIYPTSAPTNASIYLFTAFFCVALSITAFPVLARIVSERRLNSRPFGVLALTCAAADDVAAWCMLSIVVGFANARAQAGVVTLFLAASYVGAMLAFVRPMLARFAQRAEDAPRATWTNQVVMLGGLTASALTTEWIGIHALFGAFLLGALVPANSRLAHETRRGLGYVVTLVLPIFFALTGLRTRLGLLGSTSAWLLCLLIVGVAFAGKLGGVWLAARWSGIVQREAAGLGILMNARGLMELIVLNIGLDLGIISPTLFAMMVLMALVTTCATGPLLTRIGYAAP